jgi:hypothetical protein
LRDRYDSNDVVVIPHAHQPADWRIIDTDLERVVEITSAHGTFEWFGRKYLDQGLEVGLIGSSDDRIGHPGYRPRTGWSEYSSALGAMAATYATENSRDAIFDAIRARLMLPTVSGLFSRLLWVSTDWVRGCHKIRLETLLARPLVRPLSTLLLW